MMRIALIRPEDSTVAEVTPALGVLYLTAVLRRELGAEVHVFDRQTAREREPEFLDRLTALSPDIVGLSALSCQSAAVHRLAGLIRSRLPHARMIAGGAYASTQPDLALADPALDVAVLGEGERSTVGLTRALASGNELAKVRGIAWKDGGGIRHNGAENLIEDLDTLPFPAFDSADFDAFSRLPRIGTLYRHRRYFSVFSSRGCPYHCTYCHVIQGKRFRYRSPQNVLDEIELLVREHGVREIQFVDDIFNLRKDRVVAICRGIVEAGLDIALAFPNGLRGDVLDEETIIWLKRAGAYKISIAIESASPRIQKAIKKNMKLDKAREVIELLARHRIMTHGFFMLGFPDETAEEMDATVRFAHKSRLHSASFFFVQPLPGSELGAQFREQMPNVFSNEHLDSYYVPEMTRFTLARPKPDVIGRKIRRAIVGHYANPLRLLRILRDLPNKGQLWYLVRLSVTRALFPSRERDLMDRRRRQVASI